MEDSLTHALEELTAASRIIKFTQQTVIKGDLSGESFESFSQNIWLKFSSSRLSRRLTDESTLLVYWVWGPETEASLVTDSQLKFSHAVMNLFSMPWLRSLTKFSHSPVKLRLKSYLLLVTPGKVEENSSSYLILTIYFNLDLYVAMSCHECGYFDKEGAGSRLTWLLLNIKVQHLMFYLFQFMLQFLRVYLSQIATWWKKHSKFWKDVEFLEALSLLKIKATAPIVKCNKYNLIHQNVK